MFMAFTVVILTILLFFWAFGHFRGVLYKAVDIAANLKNIALQRKIEIPPNSTVTITIDNGKIASISVEEGTRTDSLAEVQVNGGEGGCIYLVTTNFTYSKTLCSVSTTVKPGTYYIAYMPVEPVGMWLESTFSWLPFVLVVALIIALAIMFLWVPKR